MYSTFRTFWPRALIDTFCILESELDFVNYPNVDGVFYELVFLSILFIKFFPCVFSYLLRFILFTLLVIFESGVLLWIYYSYEKGSNIFLSSLEFSSYYALLLSEMAWLITPEIIRMINLLVEGEFDELIHLFMQSQLFKFI